jgi:hypothetical protein
MVSTDRHEVASPTRVDCFGEGVRCSVIEVRALPGAVPTEPVVDVEVLFEMAGAILTELLLGPDAGMPTACAASFEDLRVIRTAHLVERLVEACGALRAAVVC